MVVGSRHSYVYIAIPKTASRAVVQWLIRFYDGHELKPHHLWQIPEDYWEVTCFTVVRHPYERMFSWWWHDAMDETQNPSGIGFHDFMRYRINTKGLTDHSLEVPDMNISQTNWIKRSRCSIVIHLEDFVQEADKLPFVDKSQIPPLPQIGAGTNKPKTSFEEFFQNDIEARNLVHEYCPDDFEELGYEKIL